MGRGMEGRKMVCRGYTGGRREMWEVKEKRKGGKEDGM